MKFTTLLCCLLTFSACSDDTKSTPDTQVVDASIDGPSIDLAGVDSAADIGVDLAADIGADIAVDAPPPVAKGCTPTANTVTLKANGSSLVCARVKLQSLAGKGLCPMSLQACPGDSAKQISIFQKTTTDPLPKFGVHATYSDSVVSTTHGKLSGTKSVINLPNDKTQVTIVTNKFTYTFTIDGLKLTMVDSKKHP